MFRIEPVTQKGKGYTLNLGRDADEIEEMITENQIRAILFDPLVAIAYGLSWNKAEEIRPMLEMLKGVLERTGCGAIGLMHFRKAFGTDALEQIAGSGAWGQVVRAAIALARDPDSEEKQVICSQVKHNHTADQPSQLYGFEPVTVMSPTGPCYVSRIRWLGESAWDVEDILNRSDKAVKAVDAAEAWLADFLARGPVTVEKIVGAGSQAGHSERTLYRAKALMKVVTKGGNRYGPATWELASSASSMTVKTGRTGETGETRTTERNRSVELSAGETGETNKAESCPASIANIAKKVSQETDGTRSEIGLRLVTDSDSAASSANGAVSPVRQTKTARRRASDIDMDFSDDHRSVF